MGNATNATNATNKLSAIRSVDGRVYGRVTVPDGPNHHGRYALTLLLPWVCPQCGGPRDPAPHVGFSFDGSLRLTVSCWANPCGHIDYYEAVRLEAAQFAGGGDTALLWNKVHRAFEDDGNDGNEDNEDKERSADA